jgi:NitT/TauT family transport system substrate-binding protein
MLRRLGCASVCIFFLTSCGGGTDFGRTVRIPLGAGGVGFLPLLMMREHRLIEQQAAARGIADFNVQWISLGGPSVMNDALLSGSVDFITAGPPAFLTLWDRTRGNLDVKGVAAMSALPMYLNTRLPSLTSLNDVGEGDKIAVTAIKVSIPAIIMQMHAAQEFGAEDAEHFDRYTVSMTHPDGVIAMLSGSGDISAHFTSPPFHQREIQDPSIRTIMSSNDVTGGATTFTMMSTTSAYHRDNPEVYAAVLSALEQAQSMIAADPAAAAATLIAADGNAGLPPEEVVALLQDSDIAFTSTPSNIVKYAEFMHSIGSLAEAPDSWQALFFDEIHDLPGS